VTPSITLVDVLVLRGAGESLECLALRRGPDGRCPGSWEIVHGHVEQAEAPADAAVRELAEETGYAPERLYNLSRVEAFYLHRRDTVALVAMFAAFVGSGLVHLGAEHDASEWMPWRAARGRLAWPREIRALEDAVHLFGDGTAGPVEDVLRVC
jgi:8-oxo-dGTP pyrophosphatase MutT (NUDIX family)